MALAPRLTRVEPKGTAQELDATLHLVGRGLGIDEWRLATRARSRHWSAWGRHEVLRGMSLVASADSAPRKADLARLTGGALVRIPGDGLRLYGHYTRGLEARDHPLEHLVGLTLSVVREHRRPGGRARGRQRR